MVCSFAHASSREAFPPPGAYISTKLHCEAGAPPSPGLAVRLSRSEKAGGWRLTEASRAPELKALVLTLSTAVREANAAVESRRRQDLPARIIAICNPIIEGNKVTTFSAPALLRGPIADT